MNCVARAGETAQFADTCETYAAPVVPSCCAAVRAALIAQPEKSRRVMPDITDGISHRAQPRAALALNHVLSLVVAPRCVPPRLPRLPTRPRNPAKSDAM